MSPEEIPPYPDRRVGGDGDISHQNQNTKNHLLEPSQSVQIDRIQAHISHGTGAKEESVNIAKFEPRFSVTTIAINTAAVNDDRREDDGEKEVKDMHAIEIDLEAAISAQKRPTYAIHGSDDRRRESNRKKTTALSVGDKQTIKAYITDRIGIGKCAALAGREVYMPMAGAKEGKKLREIRVDTSPERKEKKT